MELQKLTSFDSLKIGDKVTRITLTGFKIFVYMGDDPHEKSDKYKNQYGYFLDSFGREKVERWYVGYLDRSNTFVGYDHEFIVRKEIELLEKRIESLKEDLIK
ncbi:hypothetical protein LJC45_04940 [Alistipes sp. OttesenSCG-928-B03]|nr:hypothetical protein [Alistipes sp. OttesenSCG-928-B03]